METMTTPIPIPPDVAEAAERLKRVDDGETVGGVYGVAWPSENHEHPYHVDLRRMLGFALSLIATQQQQAAEREKPVDEEWLQSLERVDGGDLSMICVRLCDDGMLHIVVNGWVSPYHATRGELLDLLAALKIQAK